MNTSTCRRGGLVLAATIAATLALTVGPPPEASQAIVGGHSAKTVMPYDGSLQRVDSPRGDRHVCGATLIAPRWAITAGHCVGLVDTKTSLNGKGEVKIALTGNPTGWQVRFGSRNVNKGGQLVAVQQVVRASRSIAPNGDYALLKLRHPVHATPVALASRTPKPGTRAVIQGWGYTTIGGLRDYESTRSYPDLLHSASTKIASAKRCGIPAGQHGLCVGTSRIGPDNMDSGGPVYVTERGRTVIAGTVNGGNYVSGLRPSVYTDLSRHRAWIKSYVTGRRTIPGPAHLTSLGMAGAGGIAPSGCAAALVRTAASRPADRALLLTNGHCVDPRPKPGQALANMPAKHFVNLLGADSNVVARATTTRLLYATMTGTDVALYRLHETYAELAALGAPARQLSLTGPAPGDALVMEAGSRPTTYACTVEAIVPELQEAGYTQHDAIRYKTTPDCQPIGGTSGSPLIDKRTGEMVAIHNTHVAGDDNACSERNPCEVAADGTRTAVTNRGYAQQITGLARCIAPGSRIDLRRPDCTLTAP